VSIIDLQSAPTQVLIDQRSVTVHAELWRDMMPSTDRSASPLLATVQPAPASSLQVQRIWVLMGGAVWSAATTRQQDSPWWAASGGPEWMIGALTTVVAQVTNASGATTLVRVEDVPMRGAY
jgi:hypothetical protein